MGSRSQLKKSEAAVCNARGFIISIKISSRPQPKKSEAAVCGPKGFIMSPIIANGALCDPIDGSRSQRKKSEAALSTANAMHAHQRDGSLIKKKQEQWARERGDSI
ncbi:hypothetical protein KIN20_004593 [Parelaphostrongylus tenuis]|uniref:Uncharacterized protein n=1 Tax=Parelaphostrongylus tenuis TaxID=148309 RepID=A0AAD5MRL5_PARTN|nr:hypothetical protein KIN20_004593 [Parelaphostrongylus tenuis]